MHVFTVSAARFPFAIYIQLFLVGNSWSFIWATVFKYNSCKIFYMYKKIFIKF